MEEVLDVVNEHDEVTGHHTRGEVHRRCLLHRAVHILVFNRAGELFLQKRSMNKECNPGLWDTSVAGHVDSGEDYDNCAIREVEEEIGLRLSDTPERLFKIAACEETGREFVWVYRCYAEGPFQLNAEEIETGDWFSDDQLKGWMEDRPEDFSKVFSVIMDRLQTLPEHASL